MSTQETPRPTILTVVDLDAESSPAIERAASLASSLGLEVELFACEYDQYLTSDESKAGAVKGAREQLAPVASRLMARGVEATIDARWGHPLDEAVIRKVVESRPRLVVKDTHHHSLAKRTIFSNTDWNLIRGCPAPLLLVKDRAIGDPPRILAAVDPSHEHDSPAELDRSILSFAKELEARTGGRLEAIHVFDSAAVTAVGGMSAPETPLVPPVMPKTAATLEARARESFWQLLSDESIDHARGRFVLGDVPSELIAYADELEADFVVIGAVARGRLANVFIGNTAERVLDRLSCDLIVIKPPSFETRRR